MTEQEFAWLTSIKAERDALEKERDGHRDVLNKIADMLNVVHEDPKIVAAVAKLQDRLHNQKLDSAELQLACLALAECALRRRGFDHALTELAKRLGDRFDIPDRASLFDSFKKTSADLVKPIEILGPQPT